VLPELRMWNFRRLLVPLSQGLERCRRDGIQMLEIIGFGPGKQAIIDSIVPHRLALPS
jgi:hypothetical protein